MDVAIVGEDQATKEILHRLVNFVGGINIKFDLPARGGKIKSLIDNFNNLSLTTPVILLTDLDQYNCAPELINDWFKKTTKNPNFHPRVAVDEAEAWLMADREGFSRYFHIPINALPESIVRSRLKPDVNKMNFPIKSSLYLMHTIIPNSTSKLMRENLQPKLGSKKGVLYNSTIIPFIKDYWNIENALKNSYSLRKTIIRFESIKEI
jgi:hypothetical protein